MGYYTRAELREAAALAESQTQPWLQEAGYVVDETTQGTKANSSSWHKFWNDPITNKRRLMWACVPAALISSLVGVQYLDKYTGGAVYMEAIESGVDSAISAYKNFPGDWTDAQKLQALMDTLSGMSEVASALHLENGEVAVLNQEIIAIESVYPNEPQRVIDKALEFQVVNMGRFAVAYGFRAQAIARTHHDMSTEERERVLAEATLGDIIASCDPAVVAALDGYKIDKDVIGDYLVRHPDRFEELPEQLQNGLKQIFPRLRSTFYRDYEGFGESISVEEAFGDMRWNDGGAVAEDVRIIDVPAEDLPEPEPRDMPRPSINIEDVPARVSAPAHEFQQRAQEALPEKPSTFDTVRCSVRYYLDLDMSSCNPL